MKVSTGFAGESVVNLEGFQAAELMAVEDGRHQRCNRKAE